MLDIALDMTPSLAQDEEAQVLSPEDESLITYRTLKEGNAAHVCPILQMELEVGSELAKLPCGHEFDKESLLYWLREKSASCPSCRAAVRSRTVPQPEEMESGASDQSIDESLRVMEALLGRLAGGFVARGQGEPDSEEGEARNYAMRNALADGLARAAQRQEERELQEAILESLRAAH